MLACQSKSIISKELLSRVVALISRPTQDLASCLTSGQHHGERFVCLYGGFTTLHRYGKYLYTQEENNGFFCTLAYEACPFCRLVGFTWLLVVTFCVASQTDSGKRW